MPGGRGGENENERECVFEKDAILILELFF